MPLREHPRQGTVVLCNFDSTFQPPEMVKRRPVLVISPKIHARPGLCTVVCLSTTPPSPIMPYHHRLLLPDDFPEPFSRNNVWVKGDMMYSVSLKRLDFLRAGKDISGKRIYYTKTLPTNELHAVQAAVLHGLGLGYLTKSLK